MRCSIPLAFRLQHGGAGDRMRPATGHAGRAIPARAPGERVLRRMGLTELIVQTKADYVNLVVRLVTDRHTKRTSGTKFQQRGSVLFDDQSAMGPFQRFPRNRSRGSGGPAYGRGSAALNARFDSK